MKLRIQAQHLQPGDIVGSGEVVIKIISNGLKLPKGKCFVELSKDFRDRSTYWGKHTMINVERSNASTTLDS